MKHSAQKKLALATFQLTAKHGWEVWTFDQLAKATKTSASEIKKSFAHKNDLLPMLVAFIDEQVCQSVGEIDATAAPHDRLFEIMMARFDYLQQQRAAILNIITATRKDPSLARVLLPAQLHAMAHMLSLAGLAQTDMRQQITSVGLLFVYGLTAYAWQKDDSRDMSKTMATLDRHLRRTEKCAEFLFRLL